MSAPCTCSSCNASWACVAGGRAARRTVSLYPSLPHTQGGQHFAREHALHLLQVGGELGLRGRGASSAVLCCAVLCRGLGFWGVQGSGVYCVHWELKPTSSTDACV